MEHAPNFDRVRKALFNEQPDRVPLFELAVSKVVMEKFLSRKINSINDQIDFLIAAGYDYIKLSPKIDMNPARHKPHEGDRLTEIANSTDQRSWHAGGKGMITSIDEFEQFRFPQPHEVDYSVFEQAGIHLPEGMKIIAQYGDIFTWVWDFMGFETFSYALIDNEPLVRLMFDKVGNIVYNLFDNMVSFQHVGALFYSDDIAINTGLFVSPLVYRTYLFPWMTKIGKLCSTYKIPFIYHTDGNIGDIFDDLKACGIHAIHPLEPQAMDIREVKAKHGNDFCLLGNVDVDLLCRGKSDDIISTVKGLLRDIAPNGGYCLGSGNSVPEYVNIDNYRAMIETVHKYGQYPISL